MTTSKRYEKMKAELKNDQVTRNHCEATAPSSKRAYRKKQGSFEQSNTVKTESTGTGRTSEIPETGEKAIKRSLRDSFMENTSS